MKILKFITMWRFSHLDVIWLLLSFHFFTNGRWLEGLLAFFVGILISIYIERWVKLNDTSAKDKIWQAYADAGKKVEAIKRHRALYGTSLKDALHAVDLYLSK